VGFFVGVLVCVAVVDGLTEAVGVKTWVGTLETVAETVDVVVTPSSISVATGCKTVVAVGVNCAKPPVESRLSSQ